MGSNALHQMRAQPVVSVLREKARREAEELARWQREEEQARLAAEAAAAAERSVRLPIACLLYHVLCSLGSDCKTWPVLKSPLLSGFATLPQLSTCQQMPLKLAYRAFWQP